MRIRPVPAVSKASAIIFYLASVDAPQTLTAVSRALGLLSSTCLHILRELSLTGLISIDKDTKRYSIGVGVVALARQFDTRNPFVSAARSQLDLLGARFGMIFAASETDGEDHIVVVASTQSPNEVHLHTPVGYRVPIFAGATGRAAAAFGGWTDREIREKFRAVRWDRPLSFEQWRSEVETAKHSLVSVDHGIYRKGITTISTPVFGATPVARHFIGAVVISSQFTPSVNKKLGAALRETATEISRLMGCV